MMCDICILVYFIMKTTWNTAK